MSRRRGRSSFSSHSLLVVRGIINLADGKQDTTTTTDVDFEWVNLLQQFNHLLPWTTTPEEEDEDLMEERRAMAASLLEKRELPFMDTAGQKIFDSCHKLLTDLTSSSSLSSSSPDDDHRVCLVLQTLQRLFTLSRSVCELVPKYKPRPLIDSLCYGGHIHSRINVALLALCVIKTAIESGGNDTEAQNKAHFSRTELFDALAERLAVSGQHWHVLVALQDIFVSVLCARRESSDPEVCRRACRSLLQRSREPLFELTRHASRPVRHRACLLLKTLLLESSPGDGETRELQEAASKHGVLLWHLSLSIAVLDSKDDIAAHRVVRQGSSRQHARRLSASNNFSDSDSDTGAEDGEGEAEGDGCWEDTRELSRDLVDLLCIANPQNHLTMGRILPRCLLERRTVPRGASDLQRYQSASFGFDAPPKKRGEEEKAAEADAKAPESHGEHDESGPTPPGSVPSPSSTDEDSPPSPPSAATRRRPSLQSLKKNLHLPSSGKDGTAKRRRSWNWKTFAFKASDRSARCTWFEQCGAAAGDLSRTSEVENWRAVVDAAVKNHSEPRLVWGESCRNELRRALAMESCDLDYIRKHHPQTGTPWNCAEFEVEFPSMREHLVVDGFFLHELFLRCDAALPSPLPDDVVAAADTIARLPTLLNLPCVEVEDPVRLMWHLYDRCVVESRLEWRIDCICAMRMLLLRYPSTIHRVPVVFVARMLRSVGAAALRREALLLLHCVFERTEETARAINTVRGFVDSDCLADLLPLCCRRDCNLFFAHGASEATLAIELAQSALWFTPLAAARLCQPTSLQSLVRALWEHGGDELARDSLVGLLLKTLPRVTRIHSTLYSTGLFLFLFAACSTEPLAVDDATDSSRSGVFSGNVVMTPGIAALLRAFHLNQAEKASPSTRARGRDVKCRRLTMMEQFGTARGPPQGGEQEEEQEEERLEMLELAQRASCLRHCLPPLLVRKCVRHGPERFAELFNTNHSSPDLLWNDEMRRHLLASVVKTLSGYIANTAGGGGVVESKPPAFARIAYASIANGPIVEGIKLEVFLVRSTQCICAQSDGAAVDFGIAFVDPLSPCEVRRFFGGLLKALTLASDDEPERLPTILKCLLRVVHHWPNAAYHWPSEGQWAPICRLALPRSCAEPLPLLIALLALRVLAALFAGGAKVDDSGPVPAGRGAALCTEFLRDPGALGLIADAFQFMKDNEAAVEEAGEMRALADDVLGGFFHVLDLLGTHSAATRSLITRWETHRDLLTIVLSFCSADTAARLPEAAAAAARCVGVLSSLPSLRSVIVNGGGAIRLLQMAIFADTADKEEEMEEMEWRTFLSATAAGVAACSGRLLFGNNRPLIEAVMALRQLASCGPTESQQARGDCDTMQSVLRQLLTPGLHRVLMREKKSIGVAAAAANFLDLVRSTAPIARPSLIWSADMREVLRRTLEGEMAEIEKKRNEWPWWNAQDVLAADGFRHHFPVLADETMVQDVFVRVFVERGGVVGALGGLDLGGVSPANFHESLLVSIASQERVLQIRGAAAPGFGIQLQLLRRANHLLLQRHPELDFEDRGLGGVEEEDDDETSF